jgi:acyl-CoA dehydrogenase
VVPGWFEPSAGCTANRHDDRLSQPDSMLTHDLNTSDQTFSEAITRIAESVAAAHADTVDREARFPVEAITAMREAGLLSALVPGSLDGPGVSLAAVADGCSVLGRHCAATAMVFAMHHAQIFMIVRHLEGSPWFEDYLRRVVAEQRLLASVTTEQGTGGDMGRSIAPLRRDEDGQLTFIKHAPTVSYGAHADDYFTTLRRSEAAPETDQVFVLHHGEDSTLTQLGPWDPLGMRGTCSPGFSIQARLREEQVLADPVSAVLSDTVAAAFIFWSHAWLGAATAAFERAHRHVRASARRRPGESLPEANSLARLSAELSSFRSDVQAGLTDFLALEGESLQMIQTVLRFNHLKITAAEQAPRICLGALQLIGIAGYLNDSPYSVGRHLRDSLSAGLMVNNDRIHAMNAAMLTVTKQF